MAAVITTTQVEAPRQQDVDGQTPLATFTAQSEIQSQEEDIFADHHEAPAGAVEAIPDGGYGWTVVAACSLLLFWIMGYTTAWGVLQTAIVKASPTRLDVRTVTFVGTLYMACMVSILRNRTLLLVSDID